MGRYSSVLKCAEIRRLVDEKKYSKALDIVEQIDVNQIKVTTDLNAIAEVYVKAERFEEAKQVLLKVYEKFKTRRVIYQLVYVLIKIGTLDEAEDFYREYVLIDPDSSDGLILLYQIEKAKGSSKSELILLLERMKNIDYMEEWAYELAKLYHKEGRREDCISECSDIIVWFGTGVIVEKAKLLKLHYVEGLDILSPTILTMANTEIANEEEVRIEEPEAEAENEEVMVEEEAYDPLEEILVEAKNDKKPPHFVIIGDDLEEIKEKVKLLAKKIEKTNKVSAKKIAKISAEKLNNIKLENVQGKLKNGFLFIDNAGDLSSDSVKAITKMLEAYQNEIVVILGDEEEGIEWLFRKCKKIKGYFKYNIYLS